MTLLRRLSLLLVAAFVFGCGTSQKKLPQPKTCAMAVEETQGDLDPASTLKLGAKIRFSCAISANELEQYISQGGYR